MYRYSILYYIFTYTLNLPFTVQYIPSVPIYTCMKICMYCMWCTGYVYSTVYLFMVLFILYFILSNSIALLEQQLQSTGSTYSTLQNDSIYMHIITVVCRWSVVADEGADPDEWGFTHQIPPSKRAVLAECWPLGQRLHCWWLRHQWPSRKNYWVSTSLFTGIALVHCTFQADAGSKCAPYCHRGIDI